MLFKHSPFIGIRPADEAAGYRTPPQKRGSESSDIALSKKTGDEAARGRTPDQKRDSKSSHTTDSKGSTNEAAGNPPPEPTLEDVLVYKALAFE